MNGFYEDSQLEELTTKYDAPRKLPPATRMSWQMFMDSPLQNFELEVILASIAAVSLHNRFWVGVPMTHYTAEDIAAIEEGSVQRLNYVGLALHRALQEKYCDIFEKEGTFYFVPEEPLVAFMQQRLCPVVSA